MTTEHMRARPTTHSAQGFTLVEALVTLLVISIGLLGIAGLQLMSLRDNQGSAIRTQATYLSYDIIDRMRANRIAASTGAYVTGFGAVSAGASLAAQDLLAWKRNIEATLPGGDLTDGSFGGNIADGAVAFDPATNIVTVTIQWLERDPADPAPMQFVMETQL